MKYFSEKHDLETPVIYQKSSLKLYIVQEYSNNITFFLSGKYFFCSPYRYQPKYILYCNTFGCSLPNADLTKVFGRIPKGKGKAGKAKGDISCPLTPEELHSIIDTGHLPEIYNVINF